MKYHVLVFTGGYNVCSPMNDYQPTEFDCQHIQVLLRPTLFREVPVEDTYRLVPLTTTSLPHWSQTVGTQNNGGFLLSLAHEFAVELFADSNRSPTNEQVVVVCSGHVNATAQFWASRCASDGVPARTIHVGETPRVLDDTYVSSDGTVLYTYNFRTHRWESQPYSPAVLQYPPVLERRQEPWQQYAGPDGLTVEHVDFLPHQRLTTPPVSGDYVLWTPDTPRSVVTETTTSPHFIRCYRQGSWSAPQPIDTSATLEERVIQDVMTVLNTWNRDGSEVELAAILHGVDEISPYYSTFCYRVVVVSNGFSLDFFPGTDFLQRLTRVFYDKTGGYHLHVHPECIRVEDELLPATWTSDVVSTVLKTISEVVREDERLIMVSFLPSVNDNSTSERTRIEGVNERVLVVHYNPEDALFDPEAQRFPDRGTPLQVALYLAYANGLISTTVYESELSQTHVSRPLDLLAVSSLATMQYVSRAEYTFRDTYRTPQPPLHRDELHRLDFITHLEKRFQTPVTVVLPYAESPALPRYQHSIFLPWSERDEYVVEPRSRHWNATGLARAARDVWSLLRHHILPPRWPVIPVPIESSECRPTSQTLTPSDLAFLDDQLQWKADGNQHWYSRPATRSVQYWLVHLDHPTQVDLRWNPWGEEFVSLSESQSVPLALKWIVWSEDELGDASTYFDRHDRETSVRVSLEVERGGQRYGGTLTREGYLRFARTSQFSSAHDYAVLEGKLFSGGVWYVGQQRFRVRPMEEALRSMPGSHVLAPQLPEITPWFALKFSQTPPRYLACEAIPGVVRWKEGDRLRLTTSPYMALTVNGGGTITFSTIPDVWANLTVSTLTSVDAITWGVVMESASGQYLGHFFNGTDHELTLTSSTPMVWHVSSLHTHEPIHFRSASLGQYVWWSGTQWLLSATERTVWEVTVVNENAGLGFAQVLDATTTSFTPEQPAAWYVTEVDGSVIVQDVLSTQFLFSTGVLWRHEKRPERFQWESVNTSFRRLVSEDGLRALHYHLSEERWMWLPLPAVNTVPYRSEWKWTLWSNATPSLPHPFVSRLTWSSRPFPWQLHGQRLTPAGHLEWSLTDASVFLTRERQVGNLRVEAGGLMLPWTWDATVERVAPGGLTRYEVELFEDCTALEPVCALSGPLMFADQPDLPYDLYRQQFSLMSDDVATFLCYQCPYDENDVVYRIWLPRDRCYLSFSEDGGGAVYLSPAYSEESKTWHRGRLLWQRHDRKYVLHTPAGSLAWTLPGGWWPFRADQVPEWGRSLVARRLQAIETNWVVDVTHLSAGTYAPLFHRLYTYGAMRGLSEALQPLEWSTYTDVWWQPFSTSSSSLLPTSEDWASGLGYVRVAHDSTGPRFVSLTSRSVMTRRQLISWNQLLQERPVLDLQVWSDTFQLTVWPDWEASQANDHIVLSLEPTGFQFVLVGEQLYVQEVVSGELLFPLHIHWEPQLQFLPNTVFPWSVAYPPIVTPRLVTPKHEKARRFTLNYDSRGHLSVKLPDFVKSAYPSDFDTERFTLGVVSYTENQSVLVLGTVPDVSESTLSFRSYAIQRLSLRYLLEVPCQHSEDAIAIYRASTRTLALWSPSTSTLSVCSLYGNSSSWSLNTVRGVVRATEDTFFVARTDRVEQYRFTNEAATVLRTNAMAWFQFLPRPSRSNVVTCVQVAPPLWLLLLSDYRYRSFAFLFSLDQWEQQEMSDMVFTSERYTEQVFVSAERHVVCLVTVSRQDGRPGGLRHIHVYRVYGRELLLQGYVFDVPETIRHLSVRDNGQEMWMLTATTELIHYRLQTHGVVEHEDVVYSPFSYLETSRATLGRRPEAVESVTEGLRLVFSSEVSSDWESELRMWPQDFLAVRNGTYVLEAKKSSSSSHSSGVVLHPKLWSVGGHWYERDGITLNGWHTALTTDAVYFRIDYPDTATDVQLITRGSGVGWAYESQGQRCFVWGTAGSLALRGHRRHVLHGLSGSPSALHLAVAPRRGWAWGAGLGGEWMDVGGAKLPLTALFQTTQTPELLPWSYDTDSIGVFPDFRQVTSSFLYARDSITNEVLIAHRTHSFDEALLRRSVGNCVPETTFPLTSRHGDYYTYRGSLPWYSKELIRGYRETETLLVYGDRVVFLSAEESLVNYSGFYHFEGLVQVLSSHLVSNVYFLTTPPVSVVTTGATVPGTIICSNTELLLSVDSSTGSVYTVQRVPETIQPTTVWSDTLTVVVGVVSELIGVPLVASQCILDPSSLYWWCVLPNSDTTWSDARVLQFRRTSTNVLTWILDRIWTPPRSLREPSAEFGAQIEVSPDGVWLFVGVPMKNLPPDGEEDRSSVWLLRRTTDGQLVYDSQLRNAAVPQLGRHLGVVMVGDYRDDRLNSAVPLARTDRLWQLMMTSTVYVEKKDGVPMWIVSPSTLTPELFLPYFDHDVPDSFQTVSQPLFQSIGHGLLSPDSFDEILSSSDTDIQHLTWTTSSETQLLLQYDRRQHNTGMFTRVVWRIDVSATVATEVTTYPGEQLLSRAFSSTQHGHRVVVTAVSRERESVLLTLRHAKDENVTLVNADEMSQLLHVTTDLQLLHGRAGYPSVLFIKSAYDTTSSVLARFPRPLEETVSLREGRVYFHPYDLWFYEVETQQFLSVTGTFSYQKDRALWINDYGTLLLHGSKVYRIDRTSKQLTLEQDLQFERVNSSASESSKYVQVGEVITAYPPTYPHVVFVSVRNTLSRDVENTNTQPTQAWSVAVFMRVVESYRRVNNRLVFRYRLSQRLELSRRFLPDWSQTSFFTTATSSAEDELRLWYTVRERQDNGVEDTRLRVVRALKPVWTRSAVVSTTLLRGVRTWPICPPFVTGQQVRGVWAREELVLLESQRDPGAPPELWLLLRGRVVWTDFLDTVADVLLDRPLLSRIDGTFGFVASRSWVSIRIDWSSDPPRVEVDQIALPGDTPVSYGLVAGKDLLVVSTVTGVVTWTFDPLASPVSRLMLAPDRTPYGLVQTLIVSESGFIQLTHDTPEKVVWFSRLLASSLRVLEFQEVSDHSRALVVKNEPEAVEWHSLLEIVASTGRLTNEAGVQILDGAFVGSMAMAVVLWNRFHQELTLLVYDGNYDHTPRIMYRTSSLSKVGVSLTSISDTRLLLRIHHENSMVDIHHSVVIPVTRLDWWYPWTSVRHMVTHTLAFEVLALKIGLLSENWYLLIRDSTVVRLESRHPITFEVLRTYHLRQQDVSSIHISQDEELVVCQGNKSVEVFRLTITDPGQQSLVLPTADRWIGWVSNTSWLTVTPDLKVVCWSWKVGSEDDVLELTRVDTVQSNHWIPIAGPYRAWVCEDVILWWVNDHLEKAPLTTARTLEFFRPFRKCLDTWFSSNVSPSDAVFLSESIVHVRTNVVPGTELEESWRVSETHTKEYAIKNGVSMFPLSLPEPLDVVRFFQHQTSLFIATHSELLWFRLEK